MTLARDPGREIALREARARATNHLAARAFGGSAA